MADKNLRDQLQQQLAERSGGPSPTGAPEERETPAASGVRAPLITLRASVEDRVSFLRQLAVLIEAGHPLSRSLEILQRSVGHRHLQETAAALAKEVDAGRGLDEAMAAHPWYFSRASIAVIHAAHESGNLSEALNYLADSHEHQQEVRGKIEAALAYPVILVGITLAAVLLMLFYVVPVFTTSVQQGAGTEFEGISLWVIHLSDFVRTWYGLPLILAAFAAGIFALITLRRRLPTQTDRILGRVPVLGRLMLLAQTSQVTDILHMLMRHDVPLPQALTLASQGVDNAYLRQAMEECRAEVEAGRSMVEPLRKFPNLPPVFVEMLAVGEYSGQLDATLRHLSRFLRRQLTNASDRFAVILQPVMLVSTGLLVILVVLAFFTTYFDVITQIAIAD